MTPSERHALVFFAALALLGGGVRLHRASGDDPPISPAARAALEAQIAEVEEARKRPPASRRRRPRATASAASASSTSGTSGTPRDAVPRLDLDTAPADSMVRLPRIGPALAKRIIADRDSLGPFGSLEGFQRVKGVGPAMARALDSYVTFSGTPRPSPVGTRVSAPRRESSHEPRRGRVPR